jgi:hypothetical protein
MNKPVKQEIITGFQAEFDSLEGHQLAMYYGFPRQYGEKLKDQIIASVPKDQWYDVVICIGGNRSGKTRSGLVRLLNEATQYPGNELMVVRKRHEQLHNTFLKDLRVLIDRITGGHPEWLIVSEGAPHTGAYEMQIATPDPKRPSKIVFRIEPDGSDEEVGDSFKAYECGFILLEEGSQLREATLKALLIRTSKKVYIDPYLPPGDTRGCIDHADNQWPNFKPYTMVISNPEYETHWLEVIASQAEQELSRGGKPLYLVIRSSMEDNRKHLPPGYIEQRKKQFENDPVGYDMFIRGLVGTKSDGRPVFAAHYDQKLHVTDDLVFNPEWPLIIGMDFGYRRPAAIFAQVDERFDGLNVLDELICTELEAEEFGKRIWDFVKRRFPKVKSMIEWGDPAGFQKSDKGDPTIVRLNKLGFMIRPSHNDHEAGHNEIRRLLREMVRAGDKMRPRMQISASCKTLQLGFRQGYSFPVDHKGQMADRVNPRNPFKDPFDALRYLVMGTFGFAGMVREHASPSSLGRNISGGPVGDETSALGQERLSLD